MTTETQPIEMTFDTAILELSEADYDLPERALRWMDNHWQEVNPRLIKMLAGFIDGTDRSFRNAKSLPLTTYLLAGHGEAEAFKHLCGLAKINRHLLDDTMGWDWVTETLPKLLISTFDGQHQHLRSLIETGGPDPFARSAGLNVISYLTDQGVLNREETREYLGSLFTTLNGTHADYVWAELIMTVGRLGFDEYRDEVKGVFERNNIDLADMTLDDFEQDLADFKSKSSEWKNTMEYYAPIDDPVQDMSEWYCFSNKRRRDDQHRAVKALLSLQETVPMPSHPEGRKVGRNDPCSCGSGKKYKKCCLT